jgi:hypothetical protein
MQSCIHKVRYCLLAWLGKVIALPWDLLCLIASTLTYYSRYPSDLFATRLACRNVIMMIFLAHSISFPPALSSPPLPTLLCFTHPSTQSSSFIASTLTQHHFNGLPLPSKANSPTAPKCPLSSSLSDERNRNASFRQKSSAALFAVAREACTLTILATGGGVSEMLLEVEEGKVFT